MSDSSEPGRHGQIGRYELLNELGHGGQGTTFLGRRPGGALVAVKVLDSRWLHDPYARRKFREEFRAARKVGDKCTAQVLDADLDADPPYIVSEYIDGGSLSDKVRQDGPLSPAELERLALQLSIALLAIHQAEVVHRDLKPSNVLLGRDGWRVIDFGVARALEESNPETTRFFHSQGFTAPERYESDRGGPPADVFSWACTVAFAAIGRSPIESPAVTSQELSTAMSQRLTRLVFSCLARDPTARPTAQQLVQDIAGIPAQGQPPAAVLEVGHAVLEGGHQAAERIPGLPNGPTQRASWFRRHNGVVALAVMPIVVAAVILAAFQLLPERPGKPNGSPDRAISGSSPAAAAIDDENSDPNRLEERLFSPARTLSVAGRSFSKDGLGVTNDVCALAVFDVSVSALQNAICRRTIRADYLDEPPTYQVTLGVMAMNNKATALQIADGDPPPQFKPLPLTLTLGSEPTEQSAGLSAETLTDKAPSGASSWKVKGRYITFAVVRYIDGRPSPTDDPTLLSMAKQAGSYSHRLITQR